MLVNIYGELLEETIFINHLRALLKTFEKTHFLEIHWIKIMLEACLMALFLAYLKPW
jgi:hypothetical protein